jgi:hypothetical protein
MGKHPGGEEEESGEARTSKSKGVDQSMLWIDQQVTYSHRKPCVAQPRQREVVCRMQESWKHRQCWEAGEGSASPDCWSTSLAVLAKLESTPMRSWIPSVKGIYGQETVPGGHGGWDQM